MALQMEHEMETGVGGYVTYLWLEGNEGMEKVMGATIAGVI